jgi:hypothetical protein
MKNWIRTSNVDGADESLLVYPRLGYSLVAAEVLVSEPQGNLLLGTFYRVTAVAYIAATQMSNHESREATLLLVTF